MRAFDLACSIQWAIRPDALRVMLDMADRVPLTPEVVAAAMSGSPEAVAAKLGRPMDNAHKVTVRDNVAVVPINGPIFRYANLFSEISGATSTDMLAKDLATALDDPSVTAILLEIDSPGGEVAGTAEMASMVRAASARKPVHAYVDDLGASAAYWIASACERITVSPTALVGSIGVVSTLSDPSKAKSTDIEFVSSQSPKKRADISTEGGRAQVQAVVDAIADVFVADIARYRGVSADTVLSDFGQGGVFVGQAAVDAGLVDGVGSFEQAITDLGAVAARRGGPATQIRRAAMGMREKFNAWLDGLDAGASADQEAVIVPENTDHQPAASGRPPLAQPAGAPLSADVTALTERMAAMEAENAALKASGEQTAAALKAAGDHIKTMQAAARRNRFTDEVMGKNDANGARWFGEVASHVALMETLADACGEDSDQFKGYVTQQRATAEQIRTSGLFKEVGSGQASSGGDAGARLTAMATARVSEGKAKNFGDAMAQIEREQPSLFAEYRDATAHRI